MRFLRVFLFNFLLFAATATKIFGEERITRMDLLRNLQEALAESPQSALEFRPIFQNLKTRYEKEGDGEAMALLGDLTDMIISSINKENLKEWAKVTHEFFELGLEEENGFERELSFRLLRSILQFDSRLKNARTYEELRDKRLYTANRVTKGLKRDLHYQMIIDTFYGYARSRQNVSSSERQLMMAALLVWVDLPEVPNELAKNVLEMIDEDLRSFKGLAETERLTLREIANRIRKRIPKETCPDEPGHSSILLDLQSLMIGLSLKAAPHLAR